MGHTQEKHGCPWDIEGKFVDGLEIFEKLKATPEGGLPETLPKVSKRLKLYKRNLENTENHKKKEKTRNPKK
jgi:hypothetical protein